MLLNRDELQGKTYSEWTGLRPDTFGYLGYLSTRHRYLYVESPKVCCTTIKRTLQLLEVGLDQSRLSDKVHDRQASPVKTVPGSEVISPAFFEAPGVFTFCYVRNPYTRILSAYLDKMVENAYEFNRLAPGLNLPTDERPTFLAFLRAVEATPDNQRDIHWRTQRALLRPGRIAYDFIGRFESFGQTYREVLAQIAPGAVDSLTQVRGDAHRTAAGTRLAEYYGPEEAALVRHLYENDFKSFAYGTGLELSGC